jgi:hypothetical protein
MLRNAQITTERIDLHCAEKETESPRSPRPCIGQKQHQESITFLATRLAPGAGSAPDAGLAPGAGSGPVWGRRSRNGSGNQAASLVKPSFLDLSFGAKYCPWPTRCVCPSPQLCQERGWMWKNPELSSYSPLEAWKPVGRSVLQLLQMSRQKLKPPRSSQIHSSFSSGCSQIIPPLFLILPTFCSPPFLTHKPLRFYSSEKCLSI